MSEADFLLSSEVQKILKLVFAEPAAVFSVAELAKRTKLSLEDVEQTQEHLVKSGILVASSATADKQAGVGANTSFIFYNELRAIALKSFAAAEPIRAMLRTKFKDSVLQAIVLGEDEDSTIELLVVHGQKVPDREAMASACAKLSTAIGRHLKVHVISSAKYSALDKRDAVGAKLHAGAGFEIIAAGETKARPAQDEGGLIEGARKRLSALVRGL